LLSDAFCFYAGTRQNQIKPQNLAEFCVFVIEARIQEAIFVDLSCFLSFIHRSFKISSVDRLPNVAPMKKNTKVLST
jgi:hypothetical protein